MRTLRGIALVLLAWVWPFVLVPIAAAEFECLQPDTMSFKSEDLKLTCPHHMYHF